MLSKLLPLTERKIKILMAIYLNQPIHNAKISQLTKIDKQNISLQIKKLLTNKIIQVHDKIANITQFVFTKNAEGQLKALIHAYRKELYHKEHPKHQGVLDYLDGQIEDIAQVFVIGSSLNQSKPRDLDLIVVSTKVINVKMILQLQDNIQKLFGVETHLLTYTPEALRKEIKSNSAFYQTTLSKAKTHLLVLEDSWV
ncbi:MAG: putative nucleotidyltransferase/putative transcriptional regulator [Patescibacteria group bacterium]|jgi:predicted nucleotidyltransferase/predicted transcriptional regulator